MHKGIFYLIVLAFAMLVSAAPMIIKAVSHEHKCTVQKAEVMMTEGDTVWTEVMDVCL